MKKATYFFFALCVAIFCALPLSAQIYTETFSRTYGTPNVGSGADGCLNYSPWDNGSNSKGVLKNAGTTGMWIGFTDLQIESRGVSLFSDTWTIDDYPDNPASGHVKDDFGWLEYNYWDISDKTADVEVIGGQTFTVNTTANWVWANAVAFVDWDGNGAFDDHDPQLYNKYGWSTFQITEYNNNAVPAGVLFTPDWTFVAPDVSTERKVRIRLRIDEGVSQYCAMRKKAIRGYGGNVLGIPECTQVQEKVSSGKRNQNFMPMNMHRFFPTAEGIKGVTLDFTVTIKPDPYKTPSAMQTIVGAGNVGTGCATSTGNAIADEAGFQAFMLATKGDYYLTQDITLTSLPVSQTTFSGTFDGNGHTITLSTNAAVDFSALSKDECFYPYGADDAAIGENLIDEALSKTGIENLFNGGSFFTNYPQRVIAGGFCGVLARGGVIKNVKVVYDADADYNNKAVSQAPIFGLVAGINKGRIENVSVDIKSGKTVKLESVNAPTASTFGGITGVLYQGVVKHCAVNIDGTLSNTAGAAMQETLTSAFIGRLQAGIVSNVKFSGSGSMYAKSSAVANVRNYMGGIAGMTHTPQGEFCGDQSYAKQLQSWGYDNGTKGLDVNNVILSYSGAMNMQNAGNSSGYAYHCRGLLFAEAHDTITVPNLITQYAARPTIEDDASDNATLSSTNIPLISRTKGKWDALIKFNTNVSEDKNTSRIMGKLHLYKDGRPLPIGDPLGMAFTNVNVNNTNLDWAYEYDPNTCSYYSTPYAVATYTGTNANIQGIEAASANVSDLGSAVVKIDPQPETVASPSWTWSETATPPAPDPVETPICGGGSGVTRPASVCTPDFGTGTNAGRYTSSLRASTSQGTFVSSTLQTGGLQNVYFDKRTETISVVQGETVSLTVGVTGSWMMGSVFLDLNNDGNFSTTERVAYDTTADDVFQTGYSFKIPDDLSVGTYTLRYITSWDHTDGCSNIGGDGNTVAHNGGIVVDYELKVSGGNYTRPATLDCTISGNSQYNGRYLTSLSFSGNNGASLTVGTIQSNRGALYHDLRNTHSLVVDPGETISTTPNWTGNWMMGYLYVDWNNDGDFTDSGEYVASPYNIRGGIYYQSDWAKPNNFTVPITATPGATYTMRYTIDWNSQDGSDATDEGLNYPCGRTTTTAGGNYTANNGGVMVDFELKIEGTLPTPPAVGGDGCAYVANFGDVYVGDVVTYDISLGSGSTVTIDADVADDEYTLAYATGKLTVTYNVPVTPGAVAVDSIGGITKDGDEYRIAVSATVKAAPTVMFRIGEDGGGFISTDMGKTKQVTPITFTKYHGELLTAVPQGPCAIEGWYVDEGTGFVKQTDPVTSSDLITPDFTYTGAESNVIVEVRFKFEDFEGDFGNSRFTENTNRPFYISSITTTGGIVNVDATNVFTPATVEGGSAHLNYLTDQRLQTLTETLGAMSHDITVTVENADKIPANARLLCFIDYNYNGWFDFTSSADGLASGLSKNNELVYVGVPNGNASQTFTFTITNDNPVLIDKYGKTRMRFMVATYVDMYGLGPVNQYGNYQPRFDTDGDGVADAYLPLNDSNGSLYTPNNECRYENYINVADVNFEVVAYITATDTYTIEAGTTTRMGDLYIESVEDASGIHSGRIIFDKGNPTGSLQVEGNIVVRKRIYKDRWHHVAFPIAMQGSTGTKGICAVGANGKLHRLADANWVLATFDPSLRNADSPADTYNAGTQWAKKTGQSYATLSANTFYEFAADNNGGAVLGQDPVDYYWIQFHSEKEGFHITAKSAQTVEIDYTRMEGNDLYWNRNVFTIYNPYLSPIDVREITASVGWENITWKNAYHNRYEAVSAATKCDMPPYFGYWVQFTEGIGSGTPIKVTLGDPNRSNYASVDDAFVTVTPTSTTGASSSFDTPDAYTLGIDRAAATLGKQAASRTIVTLTDVGSVDEFRAGYDMPVSYADATSIVPEIWSKAGSSRMMFNDVMRDNEVVVPVGIRIKEAGEYVIRLTDTNFAESLVQLYDKQTGARVDLQRNGELFSYNFLADAGDADSRFDLIIIAPESMTDLEVIEQDEVPTAAAIYKAGSTLRIVNMPLGYTVSVCDVIGREVLHTTVVDADMQLELPNSQGVYLVNVRNEKGAAVQVLKLAR